MYSKQERINNIPHLGGGLNDRDQSSEIADYELSDVQNFEVDARSLKTSAGWVDYGSGTGTMYGIFQAEFEDGSNILVRQEDGVLQYDDGSGTWANSTSTGLTEERCSFVMLNDTILWSNGTDTVLSSTDGETWTAQAGLPKSRQLLHNGLNRILFIGQPATPSRIDWSDINDPITVGASSYQFIGKNDGEEVIEAALTDQGGIYVFKTFRVYAISDITSNMIAVDSIGRLPFIRGTSATTNNSVMCTGLDGIYEIFGGTISKVSHKWLNSNFTIKTLDTPVATYFNNEYRVSLPISNTYNDIEYVVNRNQSTGEVSHPYPIIKNLRYYGCYGIEKAVVSSTLRHRLYFGNSDDSGDFGYINAQHDQGVTQGLNGSAQTCYFITKFYNDDVTFFIKRFLKYFIDINVAATTDIIISYRFSPDGAWNDVVITAETGDIDWIYDDMDEGGFTEGYSFEGDGHGSDFINMERETDIRGVQFKVTTTTIGDVEILSQAYQYIIKTNMH